MPQVSVRPAHAPQQPPAASLSELPSCPPAVPAATGQLSRSRMRPPAVAARTVCGLGGWYVRRGPRGPQLPPRAARRKVSTAAAAARTRRQISPLPAPPPLTRARSHVVGTTGPLRGSRRPAAARARRPTSPVRRDGCRRRRDGRGRGSDHAQQDRQVGRRTQDRVLRVGELELCLRLCADSRHVTHDTRHSTRTAHGHHIDIDRTIHSPMTAHTRTLRGVSRACACGRALHG